MTITFDPKAKVNHELTFAVAETTDEGFIKGIASTASTDLAGHKVLAHAFDKSIKRRGLGGPKGVQLLHQHMPERPIGVIKALETKGSRLNIEAQLALKNSYVRDLYEVAKLNNGFSFSVGFFLDEFDIIEGEKNQAENDGAWLVVKEADLTEVSLVTFPCQPEAIMQQIKSHSTMSELEKALAAGEFCRSRSEAHRLCNYIKANQHLFMDRTPPLEASAQNAGHPVLDVTTLLQPALDQIAKFKAMARAPIIGK